MGDLGWVGVFVTRLGQRPEDVWLVAFGLACVGLLVALVTPRLSRYVALSVVPAALALAVAATVQRETMLALGLITLATTAGVVASMSTTTVREAVGPISRGRTPRHQFGTLALTPAQSRSFDYLVTRDS